MPRLSRRLILGGSLASALPITGFGPNPTLVSPAATPPYVLVPGISAVRESTAHRIQRRTGAIMKLIWVHA